MSSMQHINVNRVHKAYCNIVIFLIMWKRREEGILARLVCVRFQNAEDQALASDGVHERIDPWSAVDPLPAP